MKRSADRILTTHAGRLPSPPDVMETVRTIQRGEPYDREEFGRRVQGSNPMLGLKVVGRTASTTVLGGAQQLWHDGQELVAVLVLFAAVIAPEAARSPGRAVVRPMPTRTVRPGLPLRSGARVRPVSAAWRS